MNMEQVGSMVPLLLFIALIAGSVWFTRRSARQRGVRGEMLYGTKGWLGFFLVTAFVLTPLVGIGTQLRTFTDLELRTPVVLELAGYVPYKAFCWCLLLGIIVWQVWMANRLRTRYEPESVAHAKLFLALSPFVMYLGDVGAAWAFLAINATGEDVGRTVRGFISNFLWYLYFTKSERVKNTYLGAGQSANFGSFETGRARVRKLKPLEQRREPVFADVPVQALPVSDPASASIEDGAQQVWWYAEGEHRSGPVSAAQLEQLLQAGTISSTTLVWREGRLTWKPLQQIPELVSGSATAAPSDVEPDFVRLDRLRERTAGAPLWSCAVVLSVALMWFSLAFHLPERASFGYALGVGLGALLIPVVAVAIFSLWTAYPSQRKNLQVFVGCCAVLLATSGASSLFSRGYVERWLNKDNLSAEDFRSQANKCAQLRDLRCQESSWREYVRLRPEDSTGIARLGFVLNQRDKHEEAIVHLKKSMDLGAGAYDLFAYYADSHEKLGHTGDAIEWSYKALSVAPSLVDVRGRLAGLLLKTHRPYEALSLLQAYDSQLEAKGIRPYFAAQRISIETAIDKAEPEKNEERMALRLPMYAGHFFAPVTLGSGKPKPFMVDTGASLTSLSEAVLRDSKAVYRVVDPKVQMTVADGRKVAAKGVVIESMKVGPFELKNVPAVVCTDCVSLLGQASLTKFDMQSVRAQGVEFLLLAQRGTAAPQPASNLKTSSPQPNAQTQTP
ncbi:GYF domain-containing protein [Variovorax paradoxus]|uniref:GYF domain-containing protein n=1 Tax=Variovorax paradoxus TaxID=34073 RepID=UPI003ECCDAE8